MDMIILGLLMIQAATIYEMKKAIEANLTSISSSSVGSIQAAIKKLLNHNLICFNESVENSVNKKRYTITADGKAYFYANISQPMRYKEKSMELVKFFYMGFVEKSKRLALVESYIEELSNALNTLKQVKAATGAHSGLDKNYLSALKSHGAAEELNLTDLQEIAYFQFAMLDLSIAKIKFEVDWFESFRKSMD